MNVHFIDTSVLTNILDIPKMNSNKVEVMEEFNVLRSDNSNTLLLPLATIIETGNHIAHISDGNTRRKKGKQMAEMLRNMAQGNAPWDYYENEITREDLLNMANNFPDMVMRETGIGDLAIISAYEKYKNSVPAIGYIRIWSLDNHLAGYQEKMKMKKRRNK